METWKISRTLYQMNKGVKMPHICEISPMQYARLSKRARRAYDEHRRKEWDASAACGEDYAAEVMEAYDAGEFARDDPGVSDDAREIVRYTLANRRREAKALAKAKALDANCIGSAAELAVGDRVWSLIYQRYGVVTRKWRASVRVRWEDGTGEMTLKAGACTHLSYDDAVDSVG